MPIITSISPSKRNASRLRVHLDGKWAFNLHEKVVERFGLKVGLTLSGDDVARIQKGQITRECFDAGLRFLSMRLHSQAELQRKLKRKEFPDEVIEQAIQSLAKMGYLDDAKFAHSKAASSARHKHHGVNRARVDLIKAGVDRATIRKTLEDVYDSHDSLAVARELARKKAPHLRKLDPIAARRRLAGMLLRRGFEYETVRPVIDEVLGDEPGESSAEE